ncbi:MAG: hypothetical protein ACHQC9_01295 [Alphaproteobacteria bacterium]
MAKTALTQLQDQIEEVRREAYAAGYAAAMQSVREFAAKPASGAEPAAARPARRPRAAAAARPGRPARQGLPRATPRAPRATGRASARRPQRGTNARLVEEVLQSNAPRALRPAEIRRAVQHDKGVAMAFTSIRHALVQLEERRTAEQVADTKTWRYRAGGAAALG